MFAGSVSADSIVCNKTCQVNEECGKGYRCYVGVCRAQACPSSSTCGCNTPTPTPIPSPTVTPVPTAQPKSTPVATTSGKIKETPKTGLSVSGFASLAFALSFTGLILKGIGENS